MFDGLCENRSASIEGRIRVREIRHQRMKVAFLEVGLFLGSLRLFLFQLLKDTVGKFALPLAKKKPRGARADLDDARRCIVPDLDVKASTERLPWSLPRTFNLGRKAILLCGFPDLLIGERRR